MFLSEITILELLYGMANSVSNKKEENRLKLKQFEESFGDRVLPIRNAFETFALYKTQLRKLGTPINDFDLLIGCTALANNQILVSRKIHEMNRIDGLEIENWID